MHEIIELRRLRSVSESIKRAKQSVENEIEDFKLTSEIKRLECVIELERLKLLDFCLNTYSKTGQVTLMRKDGTRIKANPYPGSTSLHTFWNLKSELYYIVNWTLNEEFDREM